jgi:hypothetical protein
LSNLVLRKKGEGLPSTGNNRYLVLDGNGEPTVKETEDAFQERMDRYGRAEAVFTTTQTVPAGEDGNAGDYLYGVNL